MKATIDQLWETGRNIISYNGDEFERPSSFSELKKCDNVIVGERVDNSKIREVLINDHIVLIEPTCVKHPCGGSMYILEVI